MPFFNSNSYGKKVDNNKSKQTTAATSRLISVQPNQLQDRTCSQPTVNCNAKLYKTSCACDLHDKQYLPFIRYLTAGPENPTANIHKNWPTTTQGTILQKQSLIVPCWIESITQVNHSFIFR